MINYFDSIYTLIGNKKILAKTPIASILRFLVKISANFILPAFFILTQHNKNYVIVPSMKKKNRLIVSLTTFPPRINRVWLVIETILRQQQKPDIIILWLSTKQFSSIDMLPQSLLKLQRRGLDIRLCPEDLRSHKKYYYALQEYANDTIITIDDDIFYRDLMISDLYHLSIAHPDTIICQRAYIIRWQNKKIARYLDWELISSGEQIKTDSNLFFCTGGGTLFPPNVLYKDVINQDLLLQLTPFADDIWLNAMSRIKKTCIIKSKYSTDILPIMNVKNITLSSKNISQNLNDIQIEAVSSYYKRNLAIDPFAQ